MKARPSAGKPAKADPRRILHQARGVALGVAPARPKTANEAERRFQAVVPSTIVGDENT